MRFGFVTCVELGLACMDEIYSGGGELTLAVTLPDDKARRKSGRVYLDDFCHDHGIDLLKVPNINDGEAVAAIQQHGIDWLFIIGWSQIARAEVLAAPKRGAVGAHPTLLPQGRGRAAIPWTILKGLAESGVTVFQLDEGVDTGPILLQEVFAVSQDETAATLYQKVVVAHRAAIRNVWEALENGSVTPIPQDETRATYWEGRTPADGRITSSMTVEEVDRLVRATTHPYPGAFVEQPPNIVRIWQGCPGSPLDPAPDNGMRLALADGVYDATAIEVEGLATPGSP